LTEGSDSNMALSQLRLSRRPYGQPWSAFYRAAWNVFQFQSSTFGHS